MLKKALFATLDFLLFSNIFIATCAVAQALVTYSLLNHAPDKYVLMFLFCSTLVVYNLSMLLSKPADPQQSPFKRVRWIFSHHRLIISITLIASLCIIPLGLWYLSFQAKLLMGFIGIIALAYNFPFLKLNEKKIGLRNLPGIKLFLIAFVWSISCVLLPIVVLENSINPISVSLSQTVLLVAKRFLFICAITIPFDIRDLFQDKLYELKTIPVMLGEKKAWIFCQALLGLCLVLLILFTKEINLNVIGLAFTLFLTGWLIFKSNLKKNEYYYFFFLDGTMILQFLILWGLHQIS
jgi:4-hydroxybenzoate polyprenyltransferase